MVPGVRGFAVEFHDIPPDPFPGLDEGVIRASRLTDKRPVTLLRETGKPLMRINGSRLLIRIAGDRDREAVHHIRRQRFQGVEERDDASLAVHTARGVNPVPLNPEGALRRGSVREHRVEMGVQKDVVVIRVRFIRRE